MEATLDGQRLVALEQMVAQVDFWSLIAMAPRVNTFVLDGLDARLEVDEQGNGNWMRIMPEPSAETASKEPAEPAQTADGSTPLNFNVDNVQISNAQVHYNDRTTGQQVTLENFP